MQINRETQDFASLLFSTNNFNQHSSPHHHNAPALLSVFFGVCILVWINCETQDFALLSQQFFNIASKGMFSWVVLTDCYISNKYGQSVQSFFCAPKKELCRVMSSFSAACSVSDTLTRFAKS